MAAFGANTVPLTDPRDNEVASGKFHRIFVGKRFPNWNPIFSREQPTDPKTLMTRV